MSGRLGPWLVAAAMASAALFAVLMDPSAPEPLGRGSQAPPFALQQLGGGQVSLDELRGRVVLLNFWATWCKPCEDEMPAMERVYRELAPEGFELMAVSVDDGIEEVRRFQARLGLSFPILHDPDKDAALRYQSFRYPESFLVDRDGTLVARFIGPREWDTPVYRDRIRRLVEAGGEAQP